MQMEANDEFFDGLLPIGGGGGGGGAGGLAQPHVPQAPLKRRKLDLPPSPATVAMKLPAKSQRSPAKPAVPASPGQAPTTPVSKAPRHSVTNLSSQMALAASMQKQQQQQQHQPLAPAMPKSASHLQQMENAFVAAVMDNPSATQTFGDMLNDANAAADQGVQMNTSGEESPSGVPSNVEQLQKFGEALRTLEDVGQFQAHQEQTDMQLRHEQNLQESQMGETEQPAVTDQQHRQNQEAELKAKWQKEQEAGGFGHLFPGMDLIAPDPDEAWRRRCPAGLYFADISFDDLFIRAHEYKKKKTQATSDGKSADGGGGGTGDQETVGDDVFITICSKKQGNRPLRYRSPLMMNGEAMLGYGNWKGLPSNVKRLYCPTDIKQAKQQCCVKIKGWNALTVDANGRSRHVLLFFEWRVKLAHWFAEQCIRKEMARKYVKQDIDDDMATRRNFLSEQIKSGALTKKDAAIQLRAWLENPPLGFDELLKIFISKHVTHPVKLRNDKRENSGPMLTGPLVASLKRKADNAAHAPGNESKTSSASDADMDDFDLDNALNPTPAKSGVPFTDYMIFEKKVLRAPSKMKEGDGQSEHDLLHSKPYKARTPLLQKMWDDHKLIYNDITFVSLAGAGSKVMASALEVAEQEESQGLRMPDKEFKAKRKLAMSTGSDSKEASSRNGNNSSNDADGYTQTTLAPIPGLSGSFKAGGDYKYNNPARAIDWAKASIRAGDIWAFENEVSCFTSSPQKTVGVKDQPMVAFFYRHSRIIERKLEDDLSIKIPGAEEYMDRTSSMLSDSDLLKALAETEQAHHQEQMMQAHQRQLQIQHQHQQQQQQQQMSTQGNRGGMPNQPYQPVLFRGTHDYVL